MTAEKNSSFTPTELARLKDIVTYWGSRPVKWDLYIDELGTHPLGSVKVMASRLRDHARKHRERQKNQEIKRALRNIRDMADVLVDDDAPRTPRQIAVDSHRINTSTQVLAFAVEMRAKVALQGITAAQFGDPLPGRSALDRKRAGIVEAPSPIDRRKDRSAEWNAVMWQRERARVVRARQNETPGT